MPQTDETLNPRWTTWQRVTGETKAWEFMLWNMRQWADWRKLNGRAEASSVSDDDQRDYDRWMAATFPQAA